MLSPSMIAFYYIFSWEPFTQYCGIIILMMYVQRVYK